MYNIHREIAIGCALLLGMALAPRSAEGASIMVNEYKNTNGSADATKMVTDEYIEFVLTQSMTAAELANLTFGDSNATTSALVSAFKFDLATLSGVLTTAGRTNFLAGTIIVVKGTALGAQELGYNPTLANATNDDDWTIQLVAGLGAFDHPTAVINGSIDIAGLGDVVWIASAVPTSATDTSTFVHAIGHDQSPGAIANAVISQFGTGNILAANIGAPKSVYNTADGVVALTNDNTGSMGTSNGGANTTWIQNGLRTAAFGVPEPSRATLILASIILGCFRRTRK